MPKYRVIKQVERKRRQVSPLAAIELNENVQTLERVIKDLETIDPWNITDSFSFSERRLGDHMLQSTIALVRSWHRYAKRKLQTEYLAP